MRIAERLDTASGVFFFLGFVVSQLQHSPFVFLAALSNLGALFFYSIGYALWLAACQLYPDYPQQKNHWYGFIEVKNQHRIAAILGALAILCCVGGIFMPALLVPASWLFFGSNLIWCIAEYHKQKINQKSSHTDTAYMQYAMISTVMTLVPAIGATVSLFFPPAALVTFIISTTLGISLGSLSLYCWLDYTLGREYNAKSESYQQLTESLEIEPLAAPPSSDLKPLQENYDSLWQKENKSPSPEKGCSFFSLIKP
ncbi:hypothetical protein [Legionella jamestowniensis]|uniref:Transmembrane protein n=1 Tax=Legionella jamestowniensis TaxID=455 RepID=A0A0W0UNU3_9GAMM|nr:hypothetical protein [Legionella jamestowniensis]KTD09546.1 hypothetical protein Ljam_0896 [Legionella jamestowniensis]OCH98718.1 hypothetical protein A8135_10455 [Legionella jamestowniensis]SFL90959.1 hypothetical protein SAMN02746073_2569 [Legionella jamestowniensis DSM 19215]